MAGPVWRRYLRFWRLDPAADVDDELEFHFAQRVAEYERSGMSKEDALVAVRARFGDTGAVRAELTRIDRRIARRHDAWLWADAVRNDLRSSVRRLSRRPALAAAVIVTLALGLGVNAAMFSFLDRVFLRAPTGVADARSLRRLWLMRHDDKGAIEATPMGVSADAFAALETALRGQASLALYDDQQLGVGGDSLTSRSTVIRASANYLPLLGVRAQLGRFFSSEEASLEAPSQVAVISDAMWRSRFGGDFSVLGKRLDLDGVAFTIIGVASAGFTGVDLERTDVWVPLGQRPIGMDDRMSWPAGGGPTYQVVARLADSRSDASLEAVATSIMRQFDAQAAAIRRQVGFGRPDFDSLERVATGPIVEARGPGRERKEVSIATRLGGVAIIVLLIACANIINLLLADAVARRREVAVRVALGISRARLVWLLTAPSVMLALVAGAVAAASAGITGSLLRARLLPDVHFAGPAFSWRPIAYTFLAALVAGAITGIVPAVQASRADVTSFLKAGAREGVVQRSRLRPLLVALQAALSAVLLVGAGLFVRSLRNVEQIHLGFDVPRLASASVRLPGFEPWDSATAARAAEAVRHIAGVEQVAMATYAPLSGGVLLARFYTATDSAHGDFARHDMDDVASFMSVSANYFATTGIRIVRGRGFSADPGWSIVVNETMAHEYWPAGDAIGQCIRLDKKENPCYTVIGVAEDAHRRGVIEKPHSHYFVPLAHPAAKGMGGYSMVIRADPARMGGVVVATQRILRSAFPAGVPRVNLVQDAISPAYRPYRLGATLFSAFGILALLVATVGVYSTVSYTVTQRMHEFGVRIALGARLTDVVRAVLLRALGPVVAGVAVGLGIAFATSKLVASLLYQVSPSDAFVMVSVPLILVATAVAAATIPARRAARVDPVEALRAD
ncbi:MAG TPA: ABC transporter permease [Gemmatimonadaceae bacterium]|nr:ABC transporter permease [Gemmatimonadaceae bacterium]